VKSGCTWKVIAGVAGSISGLAVRVHSRRYPTVKLTVKLGRNGRSPRFIKSDKRRSARKDMLASVFSEWTEPVRETIENFIRKID
jgi:hypothetical protein